MSGKVKSEEIKYCICRSNVSNGFMIMCDNCTEWYHGDCIGITIKMAERIDRYFCLRCRDKDSSLVTTYKAKRKRNKGNQKRKRNRSLKQSKTAGMQVLPNSKPPDFPQNKIASDENNPKQVAGNSRPLYSSDKTIQTSEPEVKMATKFPSINDHRQIKTKLDTSKLKQCYGPGCTKAARNKSKYCSDTCGVNLGKNRLIEILPSRIHDWTSLPSVADELSKKKLADIRAKQNEIQIKLEAADVRIIQLIDKIKNAKKPENFFLELQSDDTSTVDCVLCGVEIQAKSFSKHSEQCYRRQERKIFITENTVMPDDVQWNVFCNHRISKHVYCKKLRVLCPLHYKDFRKDNEVCGYPIAESDGKGIYCGNVGKTCSHVNWEEIHRAELDLDKLNLLIKFDRLKNEETKIRNEMAARGNLLGLLLHQTIVH